MLQKKLQNIISRYYSAKSTKNLANSMKVIIHTFLYHIVCLGWHLYIKNHILQCKIKLKITEITFIMHNDEFRICIIYFVPSLHYPYQVDVSMIFLFKIDVNAKEKSRSFEAVL